MLWLSEAIEQQKLTTYQAANHAGGSEAALHWIRNCYFLIPEPIRPGEFDIVESAAFFSTYLTSSFTVVKRPGTRGAGPVSGCTCDVCMRIVSAPFLQAKKLTAGDKRRADMLMEDWLLEFAREQGIALDLATAQQLVQSKAARRACAYLTYGDWLIRRLRGESDGPAILALWRLIAWDARGGQRRGFRLRIADFVAAEEKILVVLHEQRFAD